LPAYSRSRFKALIASGNVIVNGKVPHKAGFALVTGDQITINIPLVADGKLIPEALPLEIIFENADVLVINKAAGMVVHPSAGHSHGTLANAVLAHVPDLEGIGGEKRPGIVHRLDKDTSGILVAAKDDVSHRFLSLQFSDRTILRDYTALVWGHLKKRSGTIETFYGRSPKNRKKMAVLPEYLSSEVI